MKTDREVQLEMDYTTTEGACGDEAITEDQELRQCRRARGHRHAGDPRHASNYPLTYW